jgi:hypothetical protein
MFPTIEAYNAAYPAASMPVGVDDRNALRSFICAGAGLEDDLIDTWTTCTLDFLPGGAPGPQDPDQFGTVVATCWGNPPVLVLAENVSLREAWQAITSDWPGTLAGAARVLQPLDRRPPSVRG